MRGFGISVPNARCLRAARIGIVLPIVPDGQCAEPRRGGPLSSYGIEAAPSLLRRLVVGHVLDVFSRAFASAAFVSDSSGDTSSSLSYCRMFT